MKKLSGFVMLLLVSCVTYGQNNLTYIHTESVSSSSMNLVNIDEFIQIINENNIRMVFYTDTQFIVQGNSLVYTITKKGYNNLSDYKSGEPNFFDGGSYYLAQEVGLNNQAEVDSYRMEAYITIADYKEALRLGFVRSNYNAQGNIYGIISREKLQSSLRYANILVHLRYYYNWPQQSSGRRSDQQYGNAELLGNTAIDFLVARSNGAIRKLNNYEYYVINIPILGGKESFLYYACKLAQYDNFSDYKNKTGSYSVKNTDTVLRQLGYTNIDDLVRADGNGIDNSVDYYLTVNYRISKNSLESNRALIREIESVKQRYSIESTQSAMLLNYILKQPKGLPFSTRAIANKFNQEYSNNAILRALGGYTGEESFGQLFTSVPQLDRIILYNPEGESFYVK